MKQQAKFIIGALTLLAWLPVAALPISYQIELTVTGVTTQPFGGYCSGIGGPNLNLAFTFDCNAKPGDVFFGRFDLLDPSILGADVSPILANIAHFYVSLDGLVWSQDPGPRNAFWRFLIGGPFFASGTSFLGLVIQDNEIVRFGDLTVQASSDIPFISFDWSFVPFSFVSNDFAGDVIVGTYSIRSLPEPTMLALLALAFPAFFAIRWRSRPL